MYRVCRMTGEPSGTTAKPHIGDGQLVRRVVEVIGETEDRKLAAQLSLSRGVGTWVDTIGPWLEVSARHHVTVGRRFDVGSVAPRFYRVFEPRYACELLCSWDAAVAREYAEGLGDEVVVLDCADRPRETPWGWYAATERTWRLVDGAWRMSGTRPRVDTVVTLGA